MRLAYKNIMSAKGKNNLSFKTTGETIEITTNHNYVKIWCRSSDDRNLLDSLNIKYSDYPLDQEIEEEGNFYLEEDIEPENYEGSWVYTSLLADFNYESLGLSYELLEDLFLFEDAQADEFNDEDQSLLAKASTEQIAFFEALEKEAFRITGNLKKEEKVNKENLQARCWFFCSGRTQPRGIIQVRNTATGGLDPVVGVKVRTYRWFVWGNGFTNSNGNYRINKKYRGNPLYTVDFDNPSSRIKIYSTWLSISDASYRAGRHSRNGYSKVFETNSYGWRFATVNNAVVKYRNYCSELGIGTFNSRMRINVTSGSGTASAPMLKHTYGFIGFNSHANLTNYLLNSTLGYLANTVGYIVRLGILPDIWIQGNSSQGTDGVYATTFHEMAHSSHFAKVGGFYWAKYISYIITYGAYGDGNGRNSGIAALGEAWGFHIGYDFTIREFGNNNNILTANAFEDFDPRTRPNSVAISKYDDGGDGSTIGWTGWIPGGIMHDLIDTNTDFVRTGFRDNASGYNIRSIYNALDRDVESPQAFRDRLLRENGNRDATDVRRLFEAYHFN